jgi:hypothetical protein
MMIRAYQKTYDAVSPWSRIRCKLIFNVLSFQDLHSILQIPPSDVLPMHYAQKLHVYNNNVFT